MPQQHHRARLKLLTKILAPEHPMRIADVGARATKTGTPYQPLADAGLIELFGFEPEPEAFAELQAIAKPHETYFEAAIGAPGPATFYAHKIGSLSSVYKFCAKAAHFLGKDFWVKRPITEIPMTLQALDHIDGLPDIDLLKMDVQGAERDVMRGGEAKLAKAIGVIAEVRFYRMYEDEPMWCDFDAQMRSQGFELHKFLFQKSVVLPSSAFNNMRRPAASQLLDGDAVYLPNLEDRDRLSDDQLKLLALAADTIYESFDLCAMCLDWLAARGVIPKNSTMRYVKLLPVHLLRHMQKATAGAD